MVRILKPRHAFTLIELLVVIAIIATLVAILLPAVQQAREAARRSTCKNNLKQLGLALHNYHDVHGMLPIGCLYQDLGTSVPAGSNKTTWMVRILPQMEQSAIYDLADFNNRDGAAYDPNNIKELDIPSYRCPSDPGTRADTKLDDGPTSYVACIGSTYRVDGDCSVVSGSNMGTYVTGNTAWRKMVYNNGDHKGIFSASSHIGFSEIMDGLSNTMAVSECLVGTEVIEDDAGNVNVCTGSTVQTNRGHSWHSGRPEAWTFSTNRTPNPFFDECVRNHVSTGVFARSQHQGGVQVTLADGSVRFVSENINLATWMNLGDKNDGNVMGEF